MAAEPPSGRENDGDLEEEAVDESDDELTEEAVEDES